MRKLFILSAFLSLNVLAQELDTTMTLNPCEVIGVRSTKQQPITETTICKDELVRSYQGQDIPVLLQRTPSVLFYSDGGNYNGYMYYRLRGMDQTRINTTLNGVPLNEPEDQGAYFSNYPDFTANIGSVQIQRGVGTSSYGSASYAGSLNFEGPVLSDSAYQLISLGGGSFDSKRFSTALNTGVMKNKMAVYARYSNVSSAGYREHSGTDGETFFLSVGHVGEKHLLKLTSFIGSSKNEMAYLASDLALIKENRKHNTLDENETDDFSQNLNILQYSRFSGRFKHSVSLYYNHLNGNYDLLAQPDMLNFKLKSDLGGVIVNTNYKTDKLNLLLGGHANMYAREHKMGIAPFEKNDFYSNTGRKNEASAFVKLNYAFGSLVPYVDIQYRTVSFEYVSDNNSLLNPNSIHWNFVNPKIGVSYLANKNIKIYGFAGSTHREPTRNDMLGGFDDLDSSNVEFVGPLTTVKPETAYDVETGIELEYTKFKIQANVFNMIFKNEITPIGKLSYIGLPLRKNVDASYRRGVELTATLKATENFVVGGNFSYMDAKIAKYFNDVDSMLYENVVPLLSPKFMVNGFVDIRLTDKINGLISYRHLSSSFLDNTSNSSYELPAYDVFDASIKYSPLKKLSLIFNVNNILNEDYYNSGYVNSGSRAYFVAPTRNFYLTLNWNI